MTAALLAAGLACFAAGALADLALGTARRAPRPVPYLFGAAGSGLLAALGGRVLANRPARLDLGSLLGLGRTRFVVDDLAAFFLVLLFGLAVALSACSASWARRERSPRRGLAAAYLLLLAGVAVVLLAGDAYTFLFAWECVTLAFYALSGLGRSSRHQADGAWLTLVTGKFGGASLLVGFLLLAARTGSFSIAAWHHAGAGPLHDVAYALVVLGFGAKLGVVPLQAWIPAGYPAAPGPLRAAMAGIAANVGAYGLWRFLGVLGAPPAWLVVTVLVLGGTTALLGIAFAGVQARLSRLIAYSSVENAGIIVTAFGIGLAGAATGDRLLESVGLLAASLQVVAHALAKSLLFAAGSSLEQACGSDELDELRGAGRRAPFAAVGFAVGAATLAAMPPTVGFVSEWFVLEALMQEFRLPGLAIRLGMAVAGALVALSAGLAVLTFARVLGMSILGSGEDRRAGHGGAGLGLGARLGLGALAIGCLGAAAVSPWEVRLIAKSLSPLVPRAAVDGALASPWVLQPVFRGFSILSPSWLFVVMPILFAAVALAATLLSRGRMWRVRRVPAWRSATPGVAGPSSYTSFAYANPLRHVLANLLRTTRERRALSVPAEQAAGGGEVGAGAAHHHVVVSTRVVEPVESYLYRPLRKGALALSRLARRLQSGRLEAYVTYMLVALLIGLTLVATVR